MPRSKEVKPKKEKKDKKRAVTPSDSSDGGEATMNVDAIEDVSMVDTDDEPIPKKSKKDKKSKEDKKEKREKKQKERKKEPKKEESESESESEPEPDVEKEPAAGQLFSIDTDPTPVDPSTVQIHNAERDPTTGRLMSKPPSGMNRAQRRRIMLIERQRLAIMKKRGVPEGSKEMADEIQKELDAWTEKLDGKGLLREEKKRLRKEKDALKLKNKRGKILTGRKLKERKKQLDKMQKKADKKVAKRAAASEGGS
ncbi:hypothetical protein GGR57DRAFT_460689 [Xylariaceae sp. FL1272]|nr:hypothetical protein GGR57DRAFT_460689 [Xylariaceae sp. FL1272]